MTLFAYSADKINKMIDKINELVNAVNLLLDKSAES